MPQALQQDIFGSLAYTGPTATEAERLLEKYPAAPPSHFYFLALKERYAWISQLPEERQNELRAFFRDIESLRRRRQEARASEEKRSHGWA